MYIPDGATEDYGQYGKEKSKDTLNYVDSGLYSIARAIVLFNLSESDIEEISKNSHVDSKKFDNLYMWGWLGNKVESKGWKSILQKNKVSSKIKNVTYKQVVDHYCGFHTCEICEDKAGFEGSIKIIYNGKTYCCPRGVEHYILKHDYKPSDEVIEAVLKGKYVDREMIVRELIEKNPRKLKLAIKKVKEEIAYQEEAEIRRKEAEERRMRLFSPHQRELISSAVNGRGDFVSLED